MAVESFKPQQFSNVVKIIIKYIDIVRLNIKFRQHFGLLKNADKK